MDGEIGDYNEEVARQYALFENPVQASCHIVNFLGNF